MNIITKQLAIKLPKDHNIIFKQWVDPLDYSTLYLLLEKTKKLTIYDVTTNNTLPTGTIIGVRDHINRTNKNPLIGLQGKLGINFIDITRLYESNDEHSVIADCCGNKLNNHYAYPTHFLCHISILAKALEIKNISAFLVNIN